MGEGLTLIILIMLALHHNLVISLTPVLEGIVLLKKNADYMEEDVQ